MLVISIIAFAILFQSSQYVNKLFLFAVFRTRDEQNLVAYPANGKLFFCTTTEIHPDQELLFYYSRDYCRLMGEVICFLFSRNRTANFH